MLLFLKWIMLLPHRTLTTVAQCCCSVGESTLASVCSWCFGGKGTNFSWYNKRKMVFCSVKIGMCRNKKSLQAKCLQGFSFFDGCPEGLEPSTFRTTIWRSNQLNYGHHVGYVLCLLGEGAVKRLQRYGNLLIWPKKIRTFLDLFPSCWVPGGTRTHDIQNHNLTL